MKDGTDVLCLLVLAHEMFQFQGVIKYSGGIFKVFSRYKANKPPSNKGEGFFSLNADFF